MSGTRGSGIVSSAVDVLGMYVVRGMRWVGGVCEMYMCLDQGLDGWVVNPNFLCRWQVQVYIVC